MKSLTLLAILLLFTNSWNELGEHFVIEDGSVIWQKVYETSMKQSDLVSAIKSSGNFENIQENQDNLMAEINRLSLDYKALGYSELNTPMYIARNSVNAFAVFEFKEGKYRITIKRIKLVQNYDDALSRQDQQTDLELYALKKKNSEFKKSFLKKPLKVFNHTFSKISSFQVNLEKGKW